MNRTSLPAADGNPDSPWPRVLFWLTLLLVAALTVQQAVSGSGDPGSRVVAFIIPMLFPLGMAYWGMRSGLKGPALGGMSMAVLFWVALVLSPGQ
ncbi:MAG: hypothetical protein ACKOWF_08815 [Chloroflexota bacterium]